MGAGPLEVAGEFGTAMNDERYDYSATTPESVEREMTRAIEAADGLVAQAVAARPPTFDATLRLLSDAGATILAGGGRSFSPGRFRARVFGDDLFSAFVEEGLMSSSTGSRYRAEVLEPSWSRPGRDWTRNFLSREPSERAFLEAVGLAERAPASG